MKVDDFKDEESFYSAYKLEKNPEISWDVLRSIGKSYESRSQDLIDIKNQYLSEISRFKHVHSIRARVKDTGSLLAKIVRKKKTDVNADNLWSQITDLIGVRILYVFKNDYFHVHEQIMHRYGACLKEPIAIKLKTGDDKDIYSELLNVPDVKIEDNEVYRSIHYTVEDNRAGWHPVVEIQTRSIFEEAWSEINHKLVYKKDSYEHEELKRLSRDLSTLVGVCDSIGSLMKVLHGIKLRASEEKTEKSEEAQNLYAALLKMMTER